MKHRLPFVLFALLLLPFLTSGAAGQTNDIATRFKSVADRIRAKAEGWKMPEAAFAAELHELDVIVAEHQGDPELVAGVLKFKATVYWSILDETEKAIAVVHQLEKEYPDTAVGRDTGKMLSLIQEHEAKRKIRRALTHGVPFPDFAEKDLAGNPLALAKYRGKLVLIDFWATWCVPCVAELPNVLKAYREHHAEGFEVLGISLDQDEKKLRTFLKEKEIPWPQYFDGQGWENKLVRKYGIDTVPATFLLDRQGRVLAQDLRGEALEAALNKALAEAR